MVNGVFGLTDTRAKRSSACSLKTALVEGDQRLNLIEAGESGPFKGLVGLEDSIVRIVTNPLQ